MTKTNIFIGVVVIILVIGGWFIFLNKINQTLSLEKVEISQQEVKEEVSLTIDNGEGAPWEFRADFKEGMTAFDLLKEKADESGLTLKTKTYDIGIMVETIGDKENGQDGKYWLYYVNGELPMVAVDKQELKPGDKVEFKFEKSPF